MNAEGEIRRAKESYVQGLIEVDQLESRVWDALTGAWSPTSAMASVLKEAWTESALLVTDAPGSVVYYRPANGVPSYDQLLRPCSSS